MVYTSSVVMGFSCVVTPIRENKIHFKASRDSFLPKTVRAWHPPTMSEGRPTILRATIYPLRIQMGLKTASSVASRRNE